MPRRSFRAEVEDRQIDFRLATQGTREGEKMSLRVLDQTNSVASLAKQGLRKQLLAQLREVTNLPHGMLLVCGPTGREIDGRYGALNEMDAGQKKHHHHRRPCEYQLDSITQIEINTKAGDSFGKALRSILRQDPDVVDGGGNS